MPESWSWCNFGDLCEIITKGSSPKWQGINYIDKSINSILFITSENVGTEKLLLDNEKYIEKHFNEIQSRSVLKQNDILINIVGASIGRSCIYNLEYNDSNINQAVALVRLLNSEFSMFIIKYLNSEVAYNLMIDKQVDFARANISLSSLAFFPIPFPPIAEQHRIVSAIESAFSVIDEIERNKADLQTAITAAKSKILSRAIRGKLVPQDPNDEPASVLLERIRAEREKLAKAGKIKQGKDESVISRGDDNSYYARLPESWEVCRLGDIGEIIGGGTPSTSEPSYWDGEIPWITPADLSGYTEKFITNGRRNITSKGLSESSARLMPTGSILFSSRAPIGYCVISANEVCTNQGFKSLVPFVFETTGYVYYFLMAQVNEIRSRASGTTFKEISGTEFGNTIITISPLAEQQRIVAAIESTFEQLENIAAMLV